MIARLKVKVILPNLNFVFFRKAHFSRLLFT